MKPRANPAHAVGSGITPCLLIRRRWISPGYVHRLHGHRLPFVGKLGQTQMDVRTGQAGLRQVQLDAGHREPKAGRFRRALNEPAGER